jgi:hypothetical protein
MHSRLAQTAPSKDMHPCEAFAKHAATAPSDPAAAANWAEYVIQEGTGCVAGPKTILDKHTCNSMHRALSGGERVTVANNLKHY